MDDNVEVLFCDLCSSSIPDKALAEGDAVRIKDKVLGPCCAGELARSGASGGDGGESRMLPVAVVFLIAVGAATVFLDMRMSEEVQLAKQEMSQLSTELSGQGNRFKTLEDRLEASASADEIVAMTQRIQELQTRLQARDALLQQRMQTHLVTLEGLGRRIDGMTPVVPDHSAQFEQLNALIGEVARNVAELRSAGVASPAIVEADADTSGGGGVAAPEQPAAQGSLPAAIQHQVQRLQDPDPGTRFEAVDELLRADNSGVLDHLLPMVQDPDPFVRRLTAEGLVDFRSPKSVDALMSCLVDAEEIVRSTAYDSLQQLSGQNIAFDPAGSRDSRASSVRRWQQWWEKARATWK